MKRWDNHYLPSKGNHRDKKHREIRDEATELDTFRPLTALNITSISLKDEELSKETKRKIENEIRGMLGRVRAVVEEERTNLNHAMNYVRSSILFKEFEQINAKIVENIVDDYARCKVQELKQQLFQKSKQLQKLRVQYNQQKQFSEKSFRPRVFKILPNQQLSIVNELYLKAKTGSFEQFKNVCGNLLQLPQTENFKISKQMAKRIKIKTHFGANSKLDDESTIFQNKLTTQISEIDKSNSIQILQRQNKCKNPCCQWQQNKERNTIERTKHHLTRPIPTVRNNSYYRTSQFQKFSQYHKKNIKLSQVESMTRTRTQMMDELYSRFQKKQRNLTKQHFRSQSLA